MVRWFSPRTLLFTLRDYLLSRSIISQVDTRELQNVPELTVSEAVPVPTGTEARDYSGSADTPSGAFWFDYVADTGDGWDATYSVASLLSRPELALTDEGEVLTRGDFLLFGGDEIYPSPSSVAYEQRLIGPFVAAWETNGDPDQAGRKAYALPGNHDWYDSLSAFRDLFCRLRHPTNIGGWQCDQARSYFSLQLPHQWFVFAVDFGALAPGLDRLQEYYFDTQIAALPIGANIILLTADPIRVYEGIEKPDVASAVTEFVMRIHTRCADPDRPPHVALYLSGDAHNYQRYATDETQAIVCGGGGAFLHPPHGKLRPPTRRSATSDATSPSVAVAIAHAAEQQAAKDDYQLAACYPDQKRSKQLAIENAAWFLPRNLDFGILIAALYLFLAWPSRDFLDAIFLQTALLDSHGGPIDTGLNFQILALSLAVVTIYTRWAMTHWSWPLLCAGLGHGLLQVTLLYGGYALCYYAVCEVWKSLDLPHSWVLFPIAVDTLFFLSAGMLASVLMGWFFWFGLTFLGANHTNAFSSAGIAGYKSFLRLRIDANGDLTIFAVGIERPVTCTVDPNPTSVPTKITAADGAALTVAPLIGHLIEPPIHIRRR